MSFRFLVSATALSGLLSLAGQANASPTPVSAALRHEIATDRARDSRPFVTVVSIVQDAPAADARARGHKAPLALTFARLGRPGVLPMIELLADGAPTGTSVETWSKVRRDLVEALGLVRDARAMPVLTAILADAAEDEKTTRTVAEAVARFETPDAEAHLLRALSAARGARERAIVAGMGECRTPAIATALVAHLRATNDDATARAAVRSLGRAGNAWAWKAEADKTQATRVREDAAAALVDAFVRWDGEVRTAASNAIMVVDADGTPARIDAAKAAHPELAKELDALASRFARNPTRTR